METLQNLMNQIHSILPLAEISADADGQLVIHTNLKLDTHNEVEVVRGFEDDE